MTDEDPVRPHLLLVEDNPDDVELTRLALEDAGMRCDLEVVEDGADAIARMTAAKEPGGPPRPHLVLLDLNLPKVDGREVLQAIRANEATRSLPVVVLTTSTEPFDVDASYALGANSYIRKPVDFEQFVWAVKQVGLYWLVLNHPPE